MLSVNYFTAPWCAPCKVFGPTLLRVAAMEGVTVEKIDVDAHPERAAEMGIMSVPTTVWYRNGKPVFQMAGVRGEGALVSHINAIREGKFDV